MLRFVLLMSLLFTNPQDIFADRQPNIILVLIDDLGWPHLGCYDPNGYYESPEIDRVATQVCRFTDFYAAGAVCSPMRASIQSGQYQARFGITDFIPGHSYPFARLNRDALDFHYPHYHHSTPAGAIRMRDWKLIGFFETGAVELYNLSDDLAEEHDLAKQEPQRAQAMQAQLAQWRSRIGARMPTENSQYDSSSIARVDS